MGRVIKHGLKLLDEAGINKLMFQIGEPWWWDGSYSNGAPCIYDELTKSTYKAETGNDVPEPYYTDYRQPITPEQLPYLQWLGDKLGQSTNYIRDRVKEAYPTSEATLLFFTPQIMNPTSEFLRIINFPINYWIYPNYDFVQIEDYDWIINGELDLLPLTLEAATVKLGYPLSVVHYFIGFVNSAYQTWVWASCNIAARNAIEWQIPYIYVWAYPQVIRDGILYDDTVIGDQPAVQPPLPPLRQIEHIDDDILRPVYLIQIGDDIFVNSGDKNVTYGGHNYLAVASLGTIEPMIENMAGAESGWQMSLQGVPTLLVEEATENLRNKRVIMMLTLLDQSGYMITTVQTGTVAPSMKFTLTAIPADMTNYVANENTRNKPVNVYVMLFDENNLPITDLIMWFGGTIDSLAMEIGQVVTVSTSASSRLINWAKSVNSRYTNEDQQNKYPNDDGFKFMSSLATLEITWGG